MLPPLRNAASEASVTWLPTSAQSHGCYPERFFGAPSSEDIDILINLYLMAALDAEEMNKYLYGPLSNRSHRPHADLRNYRRFGRGMIRPRIDSLLNFIKS